MRKNILVTPLTVALALGASCVYASAQDFTSAVLSGTVTGPDNKPIKGARVYITSPSLLTPRDGFTDSNGFFRFMLLPPGKYNITYAADGFISRKAEMHLVAGVVANGSLKLRAMDVQGQTIDVVAEVSTVITPDKTDTVVQAAFTSSRIEEIGGARGVAALNELTPGLIGQIASTNNTREGFSVRGSMWRGNKVLQDGQMVNDALFGDYYNAGDTIEDLIESVAVILSPLNAKLGNTDGGIVSITTKRGGNMFSGSLRYSGMRGGDEGLNMWQAKQVNYPDIRGYAQAPPNPGGDNFSRSWQYSVTGPIIPHYLTFAIGGNITPSTGWVGTWAEYGPTWGRSAWGSSGSYFSSTPQMTSVGTFFLDNDPNSPGYGDVIRKSYWGDMTGPTAMTFGESHSGNNTFNLYLQATPNHQLSYYYSEGYSFVNNASSRDLGELTAENGTFTYIKSWNFSYRAVLGAAGILSVGYGRSKNTTEYPLRGNESIQIQTFTSYFAVQNPGNDIQYGTWDRIADMNAFLSNGIVDNAWNQFGENYRGSLNFSSLGVDQSGSYGSGVYTVSIGYGHLLDFKGMHSIDVGFSMNQVDAPAIPTGAKILASPVGRISFDIDERHIGNVFSGSMAGGNGILAPGHYKGKYIVFDARNTLVSQLEPHVLLRPTSAGNTLLDGPVWDMDTMTVHQRLRGLLNVNWLPYMRENYGSDVGDMTTTTSSAYINDMWTINEKHSVMAGLRADSFKLEDSARVVHSYTKLTPRFEYKYDMFGTQKHLFAVSYGQFHQMAAVNVYWPFIEKKWGNQSTRLWTGDAIDPGRRRQGYYLVEKEDILNPENYKIETASQLSGRLFGSVDKGFRPPTSTEISVWYRHLFRSGGSIRIGLQNRSWTDLYDMLPSEVFRYTNPNGGLVQTLIKATLKNTDDYVRTYNGVEMQWDFPISKKISFGGNYTFSRLLHNQTRVGTSESYIDGATAFSSGATGIRLETPWWFAEAFNRPVLDADGNTIAGPFGRDVWQPRQLVGSEFSLGYYLIINMSQGKARSNVTLRGSYRGSSTRYDFVNVNFGRAIIENGPDHPEYPNLKYNTYPGANANQLFGSAYAYFDNSTTTDSFSNHFTYNINMPLAKRLSLFLNINVSNVFNHIPRNNSVPGGNVGSNIFAGTLTPWRIQTGANSWTESNWTDPRAINPFRDGGWSADQSDVRNYFAARVIARRAITMSTGIRF